MNKPFLLLLIATHLTFAPAAFAAIESSPGKLWKCRSAIAPPDSNAFLPVIRHDQLRRILIGRNGEKAIELGQAVLPPQAGIVMPKLADIKTVKVVLRDNSLFIGSLASTVSRGHEPLPENLSLGVYGPVLRALGIDPSRLSYPDQMPAFAGQEFMSMDLPKIGFKKNVISPITNPGDMPVLSEGTILSITLETNSGVTFKYDIQNAAVAATSVPRVQRPMTEADFPEHGSEVNWRTAASLPLMESRAFLPALTRADIQSVNLNKMGGRAIPSNVGVVSPIREVLASVEVQLRTGEVLHVVLQPPKGPVRKRPASRTDLSFYGDLREKLDVPLGDLKFMDGLPELGAEDIKTLTFNGQPIEQPALTLRNVDSVTYTHKNGVTFKYQVRN